MGLGNGGLDFLVAEVLVLETVSFRHCAARSPYLDDIRPVADGLPHSLAQVVRAIDDECHRRAAAQPFRVQVVHVAVTESHAQSQVRGYRSGPEDRSLADRLYDCPAIA